MVHCKLDESKIDLTDWGLDPEEKIVAAIMERLTLTIAAAFRDEPPTLHAPFIWSSKPDHDPLTIEISLPLNSDGVDLTLPLREFFAELRDEIAGEWSGPESDADLCRRMAQALHDEADKFTAHANAIPKDEAATLTK